jgi:hypothetical protein
VNGAWVAIGGEHLLEIVSTTAVQGLGLQSHRMNTDGAAVRFKDCAAPVSLGVVRHFSPNFDG